ncbi:MAG TPA: TerC family protein [bacterium]|nr:TerC family protein [bacterium]
MLHTIGTPLNWAAFFVFVLVMLALDLFVFNRKSHEVKVREALAWSLVWITLALVFNYLLYLEFGKQHALEFLTGYLIEKALSVDNLFVFLVIFSYFAVPKRNQHRVLFWGILGALIMRAIFIFLGAVLIQKFSWIMYLFGAFLIFTGFKLLFQKGEEVHPEKNPVITLFKKMIPMVDHYKSDKFLLREHGKLFATPLLLVLVVVETTDVIFAVDSIPAIFAVTTDPFIVFTSNIFAILGLRALFFLLAGMMGRFHYLKYGLGLVLAFVGVKMVIVHWYKFPIGVSLGVIASLLGLSIVVSLLKPVPSDQDLPRAPGDGTPIS